MSCVSHDDKLARQSERPISLAVSSVDQKSAMLIRTICTVAVISMKVYRKINTLF